MKKMSVATIVFLLVNIPIFAFAKGGRSFLSMLRKQSYDEGYVVGYTAGYASISIHTFIWVAVGVVIGAAIGFLIAKKYTYGKGGKS
ncbi:MAG: hypothetical protein WCX17_02280 [Parcubacteria group bacterium]|jgi:hypothetical protein